MDEGANKQRIYSVPQLAFDRSDDSLKQIAIFGHQDFRLSIEQMGQSNT